MYCNFVLSFETVIINGMKGGDKVIYDFRKHKEKEK